MNSGWQPAARRLKMRTGRHVGRTLYLHDDEGDDPHDESRSGVLVGVVAYPELAQAIAAAWNQTRPWAGR